MIDLMTDLLGAITDKDYEHALTLAARGASFFAS